MTENYHSPYVDGVTEFSANDMNAPLSTLDTQITANVAAISANASSISALQTYVIGIYFPTTMSSSQFILVHVFGSVDAAFASGLSGSKAISQDAATAETILIIRKNTSQIGTITFAAAASTGSFSFGSAQSFTADDVLTVEGPATPDATLARISLTLIGSRT